MADHNSALQGGVLPKMFCPYSVVEIGNIFHAYIFISEYLFNFQASALKFFFFKLESLIVKTWSQLTICILITSIPEKGRIVCAVSVYVVKLDETYLQSKHDHCACSSLNFYKDYLEHNCYLCVILIKWYIPKHINSEQIKTQVNCYSH